MNTLRMLKKGFGYDTVVEIIEATVDQIKVW
jgi:hypothetical protein